MLIAFFDWDCYCWCCCRCVLLHYFHFVFHSSTFAICTSSIRTSDSAIHLRQFFLHSFCHCLLVLFRYTFKILKERNRKKSGLHSTFKRWFYYRYMLYISIHSDYFSSVYVSACLFAVVKYFLWFLVSFRQVLAIKCAMCTKWALNWPIVLSFDSID